MIKRVRQRVSEIMKNDLSGHGAEHIDRVVKLSVKFSEGQDLNGDLLLLIALLHDVDDYKIFGAENAESLPNARRILAQCNVPEKLAETVLSEIGRMGYSKALQGIFPKTEEGKTVSDADMCDAMGANGILRTHAYSISRNRPFFDGDIFPCGDISYAEYINGTSSGVEHFFEKILRLKNYMHTENGKREAEIRHDATVDFLTELFREEEAESLAKLLEEYR